MMRVAFISYVLGVCITAVHAYPTGPPVDTEGVCRDMFPTGHNAEAKTTESPFSITFTHNGTGVSGKSFFYKLFSMVRKRKLLKVTAIISPIFRENVDAFFVQISLIHFLSNHINFTHHLINAGTLVLHYVASVTIATRSYYSFQGFFIQARQEGVNDKAEG